MGQGLGLSDAVGGFLDNYMAQKRRKEDERRNLIIEALLQNRFDETQASNLWNKDMDIYDMQQPKFISGQRGRIDAVYPQQFGPSQTGAGGTIPQRIETIREATPDSPSNFRPMNIQGQGYTFDPNTGKWELEVEDKTKKRAGPKLSSEEWKLFNEIYKNVNDPNLTLQFGKDPFQVFDFTRRRLGVASGPKVAPQRSSVRDEPIGADPGLITPNQGFQQGQQGAQAISLPPELQNDPEVLMIVEDYKNGTLTYEDANDLISQKVAELQGQ